MRSENETITVAITGRRLILRRRLPSLKCKLLGDNDMSGSCRNPKCEPQALYNMIKFAFDDTPRMTKKKLKRMYHKITGNQLSDEDAEKALNETS